MIARNDNEPVSIELVGGPRDGERIILSHLCPVVIVPNFPRPDAPTIDKGIRYKFRREQTQANSLDTLKYDFCK